LPFSSFLPTSHHTLHGYVGGSRKADVNLRHPLSSPYNFYTWAEQINDFCRDVILPNSELKTTTIVCNSIGTISSLQAIVDSPDLFDGLFIVNPNFRELHSAEFPLPELTMPIVQTVQACLRNYGQPLFQALAKPDIVGKILREPYHIHSAIDEELVDVLLTPLLTPGAADVVFDLLSYSVRTRLINTLCCHYYLQGRFD
jgi:pimeloyl-ACP methyl ester carboxylesterase